MNLDLVVCPGCRTRSADGNRLDVRTLVRRSEDLLGCECGARYPVIDGVPLVMTDPTSYLRSEISTVVERDLSPQVSELLASGGPDDAPYPRLLEHVSIYMDAHWGDRAEPRPAGSDMTGLIDKIAARQDARVEHAVELGCSMGRITAELAASADHVVALDLHFGAVRRARRMLDGDPVLYGRKELGRTFTSARASAGDRALAADRRTLLCSDALDPPLIPAMFGRVVALNLLDSVPHPRQLLLVLDGLCAPGGELILASPYSWQSSVMADHERLGGVDPTTGLVRIFETGDGLGSRYRIEDEADVGWTLRRDARSSVTYRTHYLRARKT